MRNSPSGTVLIDTLRFIPSWKKRWKLGSSGRINEQRGQFSSFQMSIAKTIRSLPYPQTHPPPQPRDSGTYYHCTCCSAGPESLMGLGWKPQYLGLSFPTVLVWCCPWNNHHPILDAPEEVVKKRQWRGEVAWNLNHKLGACFDFWSSSTIFLVNHQLEVSWVMTGYPQFSSISRWEFPLETIQPWGYPHDSANPHFVIFCPPSIIINHTIPGSE